MLKRFIGQQGWMMSAQDHRHTAFTKFIRNLIGAPRGKSFDRDSDKIARRIIINFFDAVIHGFHFHIGGVIPASVASVSGVSCQEGFSLNSCF